jgi:Transcriptional regulator, AbiEi antitoxin
MARQSSTVEERLGRIAARAHGVVTRGELLAAGLSDDQIRHRLEIGALIRQHPGVYRVGHDAPSVESRYLAAVRACGSGAVLCGEAAACLLGLVKGHPPRPEVLVPWDRRVAGVRTCRARNMDPRDATIWRGIPVTTAPRTLLDLARRLGEDELALACHEAQVRFRMTPDAVEAVLARRPRSPGAAKLRRVLRGDTQVTLSKLERHFLELLREHKLPLPETNRSVGGRRVDCHWPHHRLTVELDSYRYHSSRHSWERDRLREREAYARGDQFRRYTYGDVFEGPGPMLSELHALLDRGPRASRR